MNYTLHLQVIYNYLHFNHLVFNALYLFRAGKTSVLVGQSGVGKSSVIKKLIPNITIAIGDLGGRGKDIGSHTTSNARLYHLPTHQQKDPLLPSGILIDSPGIRELGIWHLSRESVSEGFPEIMEAAKKCKFKNCKHSYSDEKYCAVQAAAREEGGSVHPYRLDSYLDLMR